MAPRLIPLFLLLALGSAHAQTPASGIQNGVLQGNGQAAMPEPQKGKPAATPAPVTLPPPSSSYQIIPFQHPAELSPGMIKLAQLEGDFQDAVATGGGKAFVTFFADDAVILNNGQAAILGRGALTQQAGWDPKTYQLTWKVEGAQMSASEDMGFTWGHYVGTTFAPGPGTVSATATGRYITIWRKQKDGAWKVALDASADAPR